MPLDWYLKYCVELVLVVDLSRSTKVPYFDEASISSGTGGFGNYGGTKY